MQVNAWPHVGAWKDLQKDIVWEIYAQFGYKPITIPLHPHSVMMTTMA